MTRAVPLANRVFHRSVDFILRIDRAKALNLGQQSLPGDADVAAELRAAVQSMKAEAFDPVRGGVDYQRLKSSDCYQHYRSCTARLIDFDPATLRSYEERLAFWINLYNALIIDAVIAFGLKANIREDLGFFRRAAYVIGGLRYSADDIEHGVLRGNRRHFFPLIPFPQFAADDPRLAHSLQPVDAGIHCALVCATRSCPPIAVYDAAHIHQQLDAAARNFVNSGGVVIEPRREWVLLSPIFRWYQGDFGGRQGVLDFVLRYLDDDAARGFLQARRHQLRLGYYRYDWSLNRL